MELEGTLDYAGCAVVSGWARDASRPDVRVAVEILADGAPLTTVAADRFREDLLAGGMGDGRYAFELVLGPRLRDGQRHTIVARIAGTDFELANSPREIHCLPEVSEPLAPAVLERVRRVAGRAAAALRTGAATAAEAHRLSPLRIHLVCYEDLDEWVLGKIARRLREELAALGLLASLGREPDPAADVNHHIIYWGYVDRKRTLETTMITHIDNRRELGKVRQQLAEVGVEMGICMSFEAVHRLAHFGVPREKLCFVRPAHDGLIAPRKLLVGITTRIYPDGCKREHLVAELAPALDPETFRLAIMGSGWEPVIATLRERGIEVDHWDRFDPEAYRELIPRVDYYLYTGLDEGSLGFLDAVAAGVATIVTPQGYHLDVEGGITHSFQDLEDLRRIFTDIAAQRRQRTAAVADWTWGRCAREHALVWDYLVHRQRRRPLPPALATELQQLALVIAG
jgi:hypothetical protein